MEKKIVQFIESRFKLIFAVMFGIQIVGTLSVAFLGFFVAMAGGGLDILEFDPGLSETCIMLPFVFPLTLITFVNYPRLKDRKWVQLLLIITVIVNIILAVPLGIVTFMVFSILSCC